MKNLVFFAPRQMKAKGLQKTSLKLFKIQEYLLPGEKEKLELLSRLSPLTAPANPVLLYPACGTDILFPLHYVEHLLPQTNHIRFLFIDIDNTLPLIKTILDDIGVSFENSQNGILFYWKDLLVDLKFQQADAFTMVPRLIPVDIYFERAFGIIKERQMYYEHDIFEKLKPGGILISDSGFLTTPLKKIDVPLQLSSYGEMVVGIKPMH